MASTFCHGITLGNREGQDAALRPLSSFPPLVSGAAGCEDPCRELPGGTVSNRGLTAGMESSRPWPLPGHGSSTHSGTLQRRSFAGDLSSGLLFLLYAGQRVEIPTRRWEENKWKDVESRKDKGQNKLSDNQRI